MKLYEIPAALRAIEAQIEEAEGELTPEAEVALDALPLEFARKAEYIALMAREALGAAEAPKAEAERLTARAKAHANRAERLKAYLHRCMTEMGETKIAGELATVAVQRNGTPSVIVECDPTALPEQYRKVTVTADTLGLRWAYRNGDQLPEGVRVEVGTHLRIR
jgi:hypothetical protein